MRFFIVLAAVFAVTASAVLAAEPAAISSQQSVSNEQGDAAANMRRASLVYINDVHAQIEPHPELFWSGDREEYVRDVGGLSRIATVFTRLRAERPGELLFVDGGDTIQGSGPAAWTEERVVVEPMNALGLDVAIPGNWSIAYGAGPWKERAEEFNYPVIAANMFDGETGKLLFKPYIVREINGVRLGIIGFTEPDIPTRQPPHLSDGLAFEAGEVLPPLVAELREQHRVDVVVVATHIGLAKAIRMAETIDGVDIILSADTHERTYEPVIRGDTWIVEAGAFGSFVGVLDIVLDERGEIADRSWRLIELRPELFPEDPAVKRVVDRSLAPHRQRMNRVIGHTDIWLARYEVLNTSLDNVIADAIREATGADIALSNGFRFAAPTAPGPITEADLWNWLPLRFELKQGRASGAQLHEYWERELENVLSIDPDRLFGGWLPRVSGMSVEFAMHAPPGERVRAMHVGTNELDPQHMYVLAAGNRRGAPEGNVHRVANCQIVDVLGMTTHDAVEQYLQRHTPIRSNGGLSIRCIDHPGVLRSQTLNAAKPAPSAPRTATTGDIDRHHRQSR